MSIEAVLGTVLAITGQVATRLVAVAVETNWKQEERW